MCCGNSKIDLSKLPEAFHGVEPADNSLKTLAMAMPIDDGVVRKFGRSKVLDDGSIEYPASVEHPPQINGYARDLANPFHFHPLWPECQLRMQGTKMDKTTGAIDVSMVCTCPQAPQSMKYVKLTDCEGCPLRKA